MGILPMYRAPKRETSCLGSRRRAILALHIVIVPRARRPCYWCQGLRYARPSICVATGSPIISSVSGLKRILPPLPCRPP